jgi:hypothetical protein
MERSLMCSTPGGGESDQAGSATASHLIAFYLSEEKWQALERHASQLGKSVVALLREFIDETIQNPPRARSG